MSTDATTTATQAPKVIREVLVVADDLDRSGEYYTLREVMESATLSDPRQRWQYLSRYAEDYWGEYPTLFAAEIEPAKRAVTISPYTVRRHRGVVEVEEDFPQFFWCAEKGLVRMPPRGFQRRDIVTALEYLAGVYSAHSFVADALSDVRRRNSGSSAPQTPPPPPPPPKNRITRSAYLLSWNREHTAIHVYRAITEAELPPRTWGHLSTLDAYETIRHAAPERLMKEWGCVAYVELCTRKGWLDIAFRIDHNPADPCRPNRIRYGVPRWPHSKNNYYLGDVMRTLNAALKLLPQHRRFLERRRELFLRALLQLSIPAPLGDTPEPPRRQELPPNGVIQSAYLMPFDVSQPLRRVSVFAPADQSNDRNNLPGAADALAVAYLQFSPVKRWAELAFYVGPEPYRRLRLSLEDGLDLRYIHPNAQIDALRVLNAAAYAYPEHRGFLNALRMAYVEALKSI